MLKEMRLFSLNSSNNTIVDLVNAENNHFYDFEEVVENTSAGFDTIRAEMV
jgi:hypothetical protein